MKNLKRICFVILLLMAFILISVGQSFAFGVDDFGNANVLEAAFPLRVYSFYDGAEGGEKESTVYNANEWPNGSAVSCLISNAAGMRVPLYQCLDMNTSASGGFGIVTSFAASIGFWDDFSSVQIYVSSSSTLNYCQIVFYADGTYKVTNGLFGSGVFQDEPEVSCNVSDDGLVIAIAGDLKRDVSIVSFYAVRNAESTEELAFHYSSSFFTFLYSESGEPELPTDPVIDNVSVTPPSSPYYPGNEYQFTGFVSGSGLDEITSSLYWYVRGNVSPDTIIDNDGTLTIANDETAATLEIEAISTYDSTKSATISVPVSYPLNLQITPSQTTLITSAKRQEIQFELLLPNGQPFDYSLIEWSTPGADGQYFRIDDNGLLEILLGAPAGSVTVKYAYQHDTGNVSTTSAIVNIITQQEGIYDQLTPTPEQNDKADQMEDAIGNAADKLENNNSSLGQLTPTRPQINTNLELDQEQLLAVSPLVTNIWSINGLGRMISIVLVVATVAYIFFGKRDG